MDQSEHAMKPVDPGAPLAGGSDGNEAPILSLRVVREQVEVKTILAALKRTGWNRKQAARLLNISYRGLLYKIRRHHIDPAANGG
jgi:two-component system response regulator AtoC